MNTQLSQTENEELNGAASVDQHARITALVVEAQHGDGEAFGRLVEIHADRVMAIALRRLVNYAEAQELCQDVFVQAFTKIGQLRKAECFGAWLRSIARRLAINRAVRRRGPPPTDPAVMADACVERRTPLSLALESEDRGRLRDGLSRLRSLDRQTLHAFYFEGRSLLEMSDRFDAPLGTIKRRLHMARKRLARQVDELVAV